MMVSCRRSAEDAVGIGGFAVGTASCDIPRLRQVPHSMSCRAERQVAMRPHYQKALEVEERGGGTGGASDTAGTGGTGKIVLT
jgi:hypothetical protein